MDQLSWKMLFDGWAPVLRTLILGTLGYCFLIGLLRFSGKRTLSKMNAFDFVVTIAFGSTLAAMLTSASVSLVQGMLGLALLIFLQFVSTFLSVRSHAYRSWIKAEPTLLVFQGRFLVDAMRRRRVTHDEILAAMRQQGVTVPEEVGAVVLETEGSLSVLSDGIASQQTLEQLGVSTGPDQK